MDLFNENLKMIERMTESWLRKHPQVREFEYPDYRNVALVAHWRCSERFNTKQGTTYATYVFYRVRGALMDALQESVHQKPGCPLSVNLPAPRVTKNDEEIFNLIPIGRSRQLMQLIYRDGLTLTEAARFLGRKRSTVALMHQRICSELANFRAFRSMIDPKKVRRL